MESLQIQHAPAGFTLETDNGLYLISIDDLSRLRKGFSIPLRDQDKKSLGPAGVAYTRKGNIDVRLPSGDVVTIPARLEFVLEELTSVVDRLKQMQEDTEVPGVCFCDLKDECWFQEAEE